MSTRIFIGGEAHEWETRANCRDRDRDLFFPEHGNDKAQPAKAVCRRCEVRAECLDYALGHDERYGIWGGKTERERRRLKRRPA